MLTRDGAEVTSEITDGRIVEAPAGEYVATWTASNGVPPDATDVASLTVEAAGTVPDDLTITPDPDGTLSATNIDPDGGPVEITISGLPTHNGTYTVDPADFATGPVTLVAPTITGIPTDGNVLTADAGLAIYSGPSSAYSMIGGWWRDGVAISGADGLEYTVDYAVDAGVVLTYRATRTDENGTVTEISNQMTVTVAGLQPDTFSAPSGTVMADYIGESGHSWRGSSAMRINPSGFIRGSAFGAAVWDVDLAPSQFAEVDLTAAVDGTSTEGLNELGVAVRSSDDGRSGVWAYFAGNRRLYITSAINGSTTPIVSETISRPVSAPYKLRLEYDDATKEVRAYLDGVLRLSGTDTTNHTGLKVGVAARGSSAATLNQGITSFFGGDL